MAIAVGLSGLFVAFDAETPVSPVAVATIEKAPLVNYKQALSVTTEGDVVITYVVDASGSYDPDGNIKEYVWSGMNYKYMEWGILAKGPLLVVTIPADEVAHFELVVSDYDGNVGYTDVEVNSGNLQ